MPYPGVPEEKTAAVERCVEKVMAQGHTKSEAIAICVAQITKHRSVLVPFRNQMFNQILEPTMRAVEGNPLRFRSYGVLFNTKDTKDLYGTYFDADTRYYLDWYTTRPWLYHHGMQPQLRSEGLQKIGVWETAGIDDRGVFLEGELDRRHKYIEELQILADAGLLFPSSGTLDYAARFDEDGHVLEWPIVEVSSTVAPGNLLAEAALPTVQRAFRTLSRLEKETGGIYTMSGFGDKIKAFLGHRSTSEEEETEEEPNVDEGVDEGESTGEDTTRTSSGDESSESSANSGDSDGEEDNAVDLTPVIDAIRAIDARVEELTSEFRDVQELVIRFAEDETVRAREAMTSPEWYRSLFSVRTNVEEHAEDEDADATRAANENADSARTGRSAGEGGGLFAQLRSG
ncbi:MAG: hypothetical protein DRP42_06315 [Tenericutes bacterium]|nr:MAG: hypothetical protein DRP42_06315 [Mycoplasmatota bacterium]